MKTTGKISVKPYRCTECGHVSKFSTNHWGDIYPRCSSCGWKKPLQLSMVHECLEPMPEGFAKPAPWKSVCLGDIATIN